MSYSLSADDATPPETEAVVLARVDKTTLAIAKWTKDEDRRRKIALVIGAAGALFAAVRLGWVVIPHFRKRRAFGELGK
jgi:hypothetical protein